MDKLVDFAWGVAWFIGFILIAAPLSFLFMKGLIWLGVVG